MKRALVKDSVKEIKNTFKRFLSILLMAFLGVGFFAGIRATSPDMVNTIDKYYKDQNVYDIQVLSTLGLTTDDINEISKIDNIQHVCGTYETDGRIDIENKEVITKVITIEDVNKPILIDGRLPENANECVVEKSFLKVNKKNIGDIIQIQIEESTKDNGDKESYLKNSELTIVGTVQSPLYISRDKGTSKLGAGKIDYYIYIPKENINVTEIYTSIYIKIANTDKYVTSSKEYEDYIETVKNNIEKIKEERQNARKEQLVGIAEQKITEAENELNSKKQEADEKISYIKDPKWYILDRNSNAGYVSFIQDTKSIANIGKVFPIVFFIVATLISLTSMTRMVEEQRMQIGTLKALGYNQIQIMGKYIIYASLACIIGSIIGMCVGFVTLPAIIWNMYMMMYQMTCDISLDFNWKYGGIGLILISICIIGATIYSSLKELKSSPAQLMRPKAPKAGNRVLLERITIIWKHLNFSQKVTIRNIFRYKKRVLMTIIGILGCTSLIVTGFGLKDSIKAILPNQFENVFNYDMQINIKDEIEEQERGQFISKLQNKEEINKIVETYMTSAQAINGNIEEDVQIIIPKDSFEGLINIRDAKTKENMELKDDKIYLTDKAAQLLNVKEGDVITLKDNNDIEYKVQISDVVENYVSHYMYMSKATYEKICGQKYETNVILTQNVDLTTEQEDKLATDIMNQEETSTLTRTSTIMQTLDDMFKSLDFVVLILIISAGLLAFVVLYNLANINISERIRELATIKVLGFYDNEVYNYIGKETMILTAIGILLGLIGGYCLNYFIMGTCEINILRFSKIIHPLSYIYAIVITAMFTIIVNIATYFSLKKINMIESLKSVE